MAPKKAAAHGAQSPKKSPKKKVKEEAKEVIAEELAPVVQAISTHVIFEIMPPKNAFEASADEALMTLQDKCEQNKVDMYDISQGIGMGVKKLTDTDADDISPERRKKALSELEQVPLWMLQLNKEAFELHVKEQDPKERWTRKDIFHMQGDPDVEEYNNALMIHPDSLPKDLSHDRIGDADYYQLHNSMSKLEQTKQSIAEHHGQTMFSTSRDVQLVMTSEQVEARKHELKRSIEERRVQHEKHKQYAPIAVKPPPEKALMEADIDAGEGG